MKIAKIFVLTIVLAMAGYVYASGTDQQRAKSGKAAACAVESCCSARPECCVPGAACCLEGAPCCNPTGSCCGKDQPCCEGCKDEQCCEGHDICCAAGTDQAKEHGCAHHASSKTDSTSCCGGACMKTATAK